MANTNKPGAQPLLSAAGSSGNLAAMQHAQQGVLTPAQQQQLLAAQQAATTAGTVRSAPQMLTMQQQQFLQQQQQHMMAMAAGRMAGQTALRPAQAAGAGASPAGMAINVAFPTPNGQTIVRTIPLPQEFVAAKQDIVKKNIGVPGQGHINIFLEYQRWANEVQTRIAAAAGAPGASSAPAAKRAKVEQPNARPGMPAHMPMAQQAALAAMMAAGGRPPLQPGMLQVTAAQAAAAAKATLQSNISQRQEQFQRIVRPASEDEKQLVPKPRLQAFVKQVGQELQIANAKATEDAEEALQAVAEDFVSGAVSFAVSMARRRKSVEVDPADLLLYLERTWSIQVPGFSDQVKPYKRPPASAEHQKRMAAVRKAMAAAASSAREVAAEAPGPNRAAAAAAPGANRTAQAKAAAGASTAAGDVAGNAAASAGPAVAAKAAGATVAGVAGKAVKQQQKQQKKNAEAEEEDMPDVDTADGA